MLDGGWDGVKELGSKGVEAMVLETWELWEHGESVAGRDSQILLSSNSP